MVPVQLSTGAQLRYIKHPFVDMFTVIGGHGVTDTDMARKTMLSVCARVLIQLSFSSLKNSLYPRQ